MMVSASTDASGDACAVGGFVAFECARERIGWLRPSFADALRRWPAYFDVQDDGVALSAALTNSISRTAALAECTRALADAGLVTGWRDECYAIRSTRSDRVLFDIERAAMHRFGLLARGANLNGYVRSDGDLRLWVARRSLRKPVDPGLLDTLVGGGVASGCTAWETLLKEAGEEAGIPRDLAARATAAGVLHSCHKVPDGLHREVVYVYDLPLSPALVPMNRDGEVAEFHLASIPDVLVWLAHRDFTFEASRVVHDFIRRYRLAADSE